MKLDSGSESEDAVGPCLQLIGLSDPRCECLLPSVLLSPLRVPLAYKSPESSDQCRDFLLFQPVIYSLGTRSGDTLRCIFGT